MNGATRLLLIGTTLSAVLAAAACGGHPARSSSPSKSNATASTSTRITDPYSPTIDPAAFTTAIDNPYLPMVPGTRTIYESQTADGVQTTTTEITRDTKTVMGVKTVVVHDAVSVDDKTVEDTFDWYAQDRDGNVWYFGEATKALHEDGTSNTKGSFEAGVNGALPGIAMPGHPQIGDRYRQEYAKGVAEDIAEVVSLTGRETTPLSGPAADLLVTKDADLLDPTAPAENKYYARGKGLILTVEAGGRDEAVRVEKF